MATKIQHFYDFFHSVCVKAHIPTQWQISGFTNPRHHNICCLLKKVESLNFFRSFKIRVVQVEVKFEMKKNWLHWRWLRSYSQIKICIPILKRCQCCIGSIRAWQYFLFLFQNWLQGVVNIFAFFEWFTSCHFFRCVLDWVCCTLEHIFKAWTKLFFFQNFGAEGSRKTFFRWLWKNAKKIKLDKTAFTGHRKFIQREDN